MGTHTALYRRTVLSLSVFTGRLRTNRSKSNMSKAHPPELKKYMDKRLTLKLNGGRVVTGTLRGFDPFMNLVVDEAIEECKTGEKNSIGMVVVRGNSITLLEALDRIG